MPRKPTKVIPSSPTETAASVPDPEVTITTQPEVAAAVLESTQQSAGASAAPITDSAVTSQPVSVITQASLVDLSDVVEETTYLQSAPPPPSFPGDPNVLMAGFLNYMNYCTSLPMSNMPMFSSRGGLKTGSARGMPATTRRGRDADEALPCGDGMVSAERVYEYALPLEPDPTGGTSIGHTEFEPAPGHSGDRGRIFSTQDARQHPGGVDERHCTGGQSLVGVLPGAPGLRSPAGSHQFTLTG